MSNSSNYDKLCGNFTLSAPDHLNPLRRTGATYREPIYFSNAVFAVNRDTNYLQHRFQAPLPLSTIPSNIFKICSNADIGSNICFTASNLDPDMKYKFKVYLTNTVNGIGFFEAIDCPYITTPYPPPPPSLNQITLCNLIYYPYSGQTVDTRSVISQILCNASLIRSGGICNIINGGGALATQNSSNPGVSGVQANLRVETGADINNAELYGFAESLQGPFAKSNSKSIISIGAIQDTYATNSKLSNFYMQSSNVYILISSNYLQPSGLPYSYTITHAVTGSPAISCNIGPFYVDNIGSLPSLVNVTSFNDHSALASYVSGILVNSNANSFQLFLDITNFASNYLPSWSDFASYTISFGGVTSSTCNIGCNSLIYTTACNVITTLPLPNVIRLSNIAPVTLTIPVTTILQTTNSVATQGQLNISLTNIVGASNFTIALPFYYDTLSLSTLIGNFSNAYAPGGLRLESFSNSYSGFARTYDQTQLIVGNSSCNLYNYELPLVGGFYQTGAAIGSVLDTLGTYKQPGGFPSYVYPNAYSGLKSETGYRVATFKYSFSNATSEFVSAIQFNINSNFPGFGGTDGSSGLLDSNQIPYLRYKIDNSGLYNTGWLDGNAYKADTSPFTSATAVNGAAGLFSNSSAYPINGVARYWGIIPIGIGCNYDVYVKIGLKMSCNLGFDYIYLSNSFGIGPLAPSNVLFDVYTTPTTMILSWSNAYRPGDAPILCNAITASNISDPYYPRRWVPDNGPTTNNDLFVRVIASNTSNIFTLLNADTLYQANVSNQNTNGYGPSSSAVGKTDLPPQGLPSFYDGTISFTTNLSGFYNSCNGYAFIGRIPASNIINYNTFFGIS